MIYRLALFIALLSGLVPVISDPASSITKARIERQSTLNRSSLPEEAQPSISAAIGRDLRDYQAQSKGKGFQLENALQKLVVNFTSAGVAMHTGRASWGLAIRGSGYGKVLRPVKAAFPKANLNRVEYERGPLTEWYVNGPLGLEQGLTFRERPDDANGLPLTVTLELSGDLVARLDENSAGLTLTTPSHQGLRYGGLVAYDAAGTQLKAWLELENKQLLIRVAETGAQYPIVIDPWVQLAEETASDGKIWDQLGWSVGVSGNTVVLGAPGAAVKKGKVSIDECGAAYVFVEPPNGWANSTETAKLYASDCKPDDDGGFSVAIDGDTVVLGSPHCVQAPHPSGAAYVFVMPPNGWANMTETAKLTPSDPAAFDFFGFRVAVSGNTVVVGAPHSSAYAPLGAAYVFVKPANGWATMTETAKLTPSDGATGLGRGVSVNGDTVVAGALRPGGAYVFVEPPGGWANMTQTATLTNSGHAKSPVSSVAIDGNTIVAGASNTAVGGNKQQGVAYVFVSPSGGWTNMTQTATLTASDGAAKNLFGFSASISGGTVVIGAPKATVGGNASQGAVYVFVMPQSGWASMTETAELTASDGNVGNGLGYSVAMSGSTVVAGAPASLVSYHVGHGAGYIF